jgi:hypothetical protein
VQSPEAIEEYEQDSSDEMYYTIDQVDALFEKNKDETRKYLDQF